MTEKPTYLALLNRIANAEADAETYLGTWAAVTPDEDVRRILTTIALREGEHGKAFAKRMCELGYSVEPVTGTMAERMPIASSTTLTDREKFEKLGFGKPTDTSVPDQYPAMFADQTIDIQTGELLGRFVSEERDSIRLFQGCYQELCAQGNGAGGADAATLGRIESLLERLVAKVGG